MFELSLHTYKHSEFNGINHSNKLLLLLLLTKSKGSLHW
jgi:hypothetical protein